MDFGLAQLVDENLPNRKRKRESDAEVCIANSTFQNIQQNINLLTG